MSNVSKVPSAPVPPVARQAHRGADDNLSEDTKRFIDRHLSTGDKRPPACKLGLEGIVSSGVPMALFR
jgi:hypothetical protein